MAEFHQLQAYLCYSHCCVSYNIGLKTRLVLYSLHGHHLIRQIAPDYILFFCIIIVTIHGVPKTGIEKFLQLQENEIILKLHCRARLLSYKIEHRVLKHIRHCKHRS